MTARVRHSLLDRPALTRILCRRKRPFFPFHPPVSPARRRAGLRLGLHELRQSPDEVPGGRDRPDRDLPSQLLPLHAAAAGRRDWNSGREVDRRAREEGPGQQGGVLRGGLSLDRPRGEEAGVLVSLFWEGDGGGGEKEEERRERTERRERRKKDLSSFFLFSFKKKIYIYQPASPRTPGSTRPASRSPTTSS